MPELPDVAGFKRYFDATAAGRRVRHTRTHDARLLQGVTPRSLAARLKDKSLGSARRHGKFLLSPTGKGFLVLHFGMTGSLDCHDRDRGHADHARLTLELDDGRDLDVISQRMLGRIGFAADFDAFIDEQGLGPDALDDALDTDALAQRLEGRRGPIKPVLMDQSLLAGIGNVYADEILFQAGLDPRSRADRLDRRTLTKLHRVMRRVLRVAADKAGRIDQLPRTYLLRRRDAGRDDCPGCGGTLRKITLSGRTTWYCPACQSRP